MVGFTYKVFASKVYSLSIKNATLTIQVSVALEIMRHEKSEWQGLPFAIYHLPFIIYHSSFTIHHLPFKNLQFRAFDL
jgi:hypothetical protein